MLFRSDVMGCTEECVCVGEREREERERGKKHLPLDFDSFKFAI